MLDGELLRAARRRDGPRMSAVREPSATDADRWMATVRERVETSLDRVLPAASTHPTKLHAAMRYATLGGGKRVRAMLVHAAGAWAAGDTPPPPPSTRRPARSN